MTKPCSSRAPRLFIALVALTSCTPVHLTHSPETQFSQNEIRLAVHQTPEKRAKSEATGTHWIVATQGIEATRAAREILEAGGNLTDAAIAASFVISVERPHSTGLGGGGFWLFREAKSGKTYAVDFRERAPALARADMYLDNQGNVKEGATLNGPGAAATPGLVAGLAEIHARFGHLPWARVLAPAIRVAEQGFPIYPDLAKSLEVRKEVLARYPDSRRIFLHPDGSHLKLGELLIQKDLARTLRVLAKNGRKGFYQGPIAQALLQASRRDGGFIREHDLATYPVRWREPLQSEFRGYRLYAMPPPSSGGIHVLQILGMLANNPPGQFGPQTAATTHYLASAMQLAFADRATYLGDPEFVKVPTQALISPDYLRERYREINPEHARPADQIRAGTLPQEESHQTTHLSLMDSEGNAIATTQTINGRMGSAYVVPGTGILLNNEMDDFSAKPGAANQFGAIGGASNAIAPGKTPLSSMSPTLVEKDGRILMTVGAPGGTRIITCTAQTLLNYLDLRYSLYNAVAAVRVHQQWRPDHLDVDAPGLAPDVMKKLEQYGHHVQAGTVGCNVMATAQEERSLHGVSDPRDIGTATGN